MSILGNLKKKTAEIDLSKSPACCESPQDTRKNRMREFALDRAFGILYHHGNKFALRSGPEFHAEWLRDEP